MLVRRFLASLALVLVAAACDENLTSPPAANPPAALHFVRWAGTSARQFAAEGAASEQLIPYSNRAFLNGPAAPAVVDNSSSATASASSLSWSHTVGTGDNRLLVVGVSIENNGKAVSAVSYKGVALSPLGVETSSTGIRAEMWYLVAPASGTGTVAVSLSGSASLVAGATSFTGVDQFAPFSGFASVGSTSSGTTASVVIASSSSELVVSTLAIDGNASTRTPASGQTQRWNRVSSGADVAGAASTASGGSSVTMGWTASSRQPWALAAASIKPYVPASLGLTTYQATFWAKRGQSRSIQINYSANGGTSPFMKLTISDPTYAPGKGNLKVGDSVLVTATIDPDNIAVDLQPTGTLFGTPTQLKFWYGGANGDLNGDGVVNAADSTIESQLLGMWYQEGTSNPWTSIPATQSLSTKSFTASIGHFSGYAVSW